MKFEFVVEIPAPREVVWEVAQNTQIRPAWDVRVRMYTVHGVAGVGVPLSIVFRVPFVRPVGHGEFVRFDPPFQSAIRIDAVTHGIVPPGGGTWIFEEILGGTRFTTRFSLKDDVPGTAPAWLLRIMARLDTIRSLRKLRRLVANSMKTRNLQPA